MIIRAVIFVKILFNVNKINIIVLLKPIEMLLYFADKKLNYVMNVLIILFLQFHQIKNAQLFVLLMLIVLKDSLFATMGGVINKSQLQENIINFESK